MTGTENCDPDSAMTNRRRRLARENLMKVARWKILPLLFVALQGVAPQLFAQGKMFKCVLSGRTTYQQVACPESLPLAETAMKADVEAKRERSPSRQSDAAVVRNAPIRASAASDPPSRSETTVAQGRK